MILLRSANNSDLHSIHHLAQKSETGITSLAKDFDLLKARLEHSQQSHQQIVGQAGDEYYLFVLEDSRSKQILGVSGIAARVGCTTPFYSFKLSKHTQVCHSLSIRNEYDVLTPVNDKGGCTELCTLFLDPEYRQKKNGSLLSKARFLFMAEHPQRFTQTVIAELRGVSNDKAQAPFWNHLGVHFFKMTFAQASALVLSTNKQFIEELMPQHPIYVSLLAPEAQEVLGKPHPASIPAMEILMKEGFRFNNYVHLFDGGPTLETPMSQISSIALSQIKTLAHISDAIDSAEYLISNTSIPFRASIHCALISDKDNLCTLSKETADLLHVKIGDSIRLTPR